VKLLTMNCTLRSRTKQTSTSDRLQTCPGHINSTDYRERSV